MRLLRAIIGLLLIPCGLGAGRAVLQLIASADGSTQTAPILALGGGCALWLALFWLLPLPVRTYVLAHELTHVLWGWFFGAEVVGITVSKKGGSAKLTETNFLVALAPYFFPLYTVLVILAYFLLSVFIDLRPYYLFWLALVGMTLGFHATFTITTLSHPQSDVAMYGRLFSYAIIFFCNMLAVGLLLTLVLPFTLWEFTARLGAGIAWAWVECAQALAGGWRRLQQALTQ